MVFKSAVSFKAAGKGLLLLAMSFSVTGLQARYRDPWEQHRRIMQEFSVFVNGIPINIEPPHNQKPQQPQGRNFIPEPEPEEPKVTGAITFADIAGLEDVKTELRDIIGFLKNPAQATRLGARIPRGILFSGEPGNGKTFLAKALAGEAGCTFHSLCASELSSKYVGQTAENIRNIFTQARAESPAIIFIDEFDSIAGNRGKGEDAASQNSREALNQLLAEMDGFSTDPLRPVIIIAATNDVEVLDKAALRAGRFDSVFLVPYPATDARKQIIGMYLQKVIGDPTIDLDRFAKETSGFSAAELAQMVNRAAILATRYHKNRVEANDMESARRDIIADNKRKGGRVLEPGGVNVRLGDVSGLEEAKDDVRDLIDFLQDTNCGKDLGAKINRGILFNGPPGNGKTLLAKAIAGEAGCPFISVSGSEFVEKYAGVGAKRIRDVFAQARRHAPSIIFFDEIDAIGARRGAMDSSADREYAQTLNQLLIEMDGFANGREKGQVVVIAATNRSDMLDEALLRPGRFDRQVEVGLPDIGARVKILNQYLKGVTIVGTMNVEEIARGTTGFSGADLENLVNQAALYAKRRHATSVELTDFWQARDTVLVGPERKSAVMSEESKRETAYHEGGHTLIRIILKSILKRKTSSFLKVTIMPRGRSLGTSWSLPESDVTSMNGDQCRSEIMVALGGKIAEELVLGHTTTGVSNDLVQATKIADDMVCKYGMSKLGSIAVSDERSRRAYSEDIKHAKNEIIESCYAEAKQLMHEHIDKLHKIAQALIKEETLSAERTYEILGLSV